nr:sigma-54 dependent transcriptional regulator [Kordiimonas aquimaris]
MAKLEGAILIVDDDEDILVAGKLLLKRHYGTIITCNNPDKIPQLMADQTFDAILLDMNFGPGESSGDQGFYWLSRILELDPQAVVVMITAHGGVNVAVEAMKKGATDFVAKPWQNEKLVATLSASVKLRQSRSEAEQLKTENRTLAQVTNAQKQSIIGTSKGIKDVLSFIDRSAPTDANVLILGENGTGKELVARELHLKSNRAERVFMSVDLGAIPETLFESELFGHKKGAFTDARDNRVGRLQAATGGTLFLDEIGNLPLHLQAKLLTVLEQRTVVPVGSDKAIPFDVRVIAATNVSAEKLRDESVFRQDLLFRLNTVEILVPPLRERRDDIPPIAEYYASFYCRKYNQSLKPFAPETLEAISAADWPGNVRALRHAIERAVILSQGNTLTVADFHISEEGTTTNDKSIAVTAAPQGTSANNLVTEGLNLERLECNAITQALKKHRYNISHAAKELGITRAALYRRMEKHGL